MMSRRSSRLSNHSGKRSTGSPKRQATSTRRQRVTRTEAVTKLIAPEPSRRLPGIDRQINTSFGRVFSVGNFFAEYSIVQADHATRGPVFDTWPRAESNGFIRN